MYVYLMQSIIRNIFKIGYSQSPEERMRRINNDWHRGMGGDPPIHSIVWVCHSDNVRGLEVQLHGYYSDACIVNLGEYFYFSDVESVLTHLKGLTGQSALLLDDRITSGLELVDLNTFVNANPVWAFRKFSVWFQSEFPETVTISDDAQKAINNLRGLGDYVSFG